MSVRGATSKEGLKWRTRLVCKLWKTGALIVGGGILIGGVCSTWPTIGIARDEAGDPDLSEIVVRRADPMGAIIQAANRTKALLEDAYLQGTVLTRSILEEAYRTRADLLGVNFQGANLKEANLQKAYLRGAILTRAILWRANLTRANLQAADLRGAYLTKANLREADLTSANLQGAYLQEANLWGAILTGTDLTEANLTGTILQETDLRGVDLSQTRGLSNEQIAGALTDDRTRLPGDLDESE